ncbi:MAG: sigma-70 family RNA polymerase sigma factor [Planctomycetota bacterium]|nr:sigma-70 family RNA polymerase sigma factor [Planctomycetota bacterium]
MPDLPPSQLENKEEQQALQFAMDGDCRPLGVVLETYRDPLRRMLRLRLPQAMAARVDTSDILQEALVQVTRRLPKYLEDRNHTPEGKGLPLFLWVRFLTGQELIRQQRVHMGASPRAVGMECGQAIGGVPYASSQDMAAALVDSGVSPSNAASDREAREILAESLESLDQEDREILMMRNFEHLTNQSIAQLLGMSEGGASLKHLRALKKLRTALHEKGLSFEDGFHDGRAR